jgi:hypothetical protein
MKLILCTNGLTTEGKNELNGLGIKARDWIPKQEEEL